MKYQNNCVNDDADVGSTVFDVGRDVGGLDEQQSMAACDVEGELPPHTLDRGLDVDARGPEQRDDLLEDPPLGKRKCEALSHRAPW